MKNLKFLSFMLFAIMSVSLISCGDDDEIGGRDTLVGKWQCTWAVGEVHAAKQSEDNDEWNEEGDFTVTFNEDGTASGYIGKDIGEVEAAKWSVVMNDGILCVNFTNAGKNIQYEFSYDDDMNIVLSSDNETLTLAKI